MQKSEIRIDKRIVQSTYKRKYQKCFGIDHIFFYKENCLGREVGCSKCHRNGHFENYAQLTETYELKFC